MIVLGKLDEKIDEIQKFLNELDDAIPPTLEEYGSNSVVRAACERYFEKIVEAITDLAFIAISQKKYRIPEDDADSFKILEENKVISHDLYKSLKDAKGMRNFIAHQYGKINDGLVYEAMSEEIEEDAKKFIEAIEKLK